MFLPNVTKINLYNFELYRFKVGAFFETQYSYELMNFWFCKFVSLSNQKSASY